MNSFGFYEFIWIEEHYNICNGFLSSLKNFVSYNFIMRNHIKKIKDNKKPKIKLINKKEKRFNKKMDILQLKKSNKINFVPKKFTKTKKKNNYIY